VVEQEMDEKSEVTESLILSSLTEVVLITVSSDGGHPEAPKDILSQEENSCLVCHATLATTCLHSRM
jgi:hypothetical protein